MLLLVATTFNVAQGQETLIAGAATGVAGGGCSGGAYESINTDSLEAVFIFMRHGVRAPWTTYPKDPHINQTNRWPNGRSQLTSFGIKQVTNIGNLLNKRYGTFTRGLKRSQIYQRASAAQRCIDTLKLVSSRLWPNFDNAHTPVIYSLPKKVDSLLYEEPKCPLAETEESNNINSAAVSAYENQTDIKDLYAYVAENTGLPPTMSGVTKAFDCVRCDKINGFKVPKWASVNNVYERMGNVYTKNLNFLYATEKARRFRSGPIIQEVIDSITAIKNTDEKDKESIKRAYLYTTHDYKIASLLLGLGEKLYKYPPFAATVIFEVHRDPLGTGDPIIRSYYISQTVKEPYTIEQLRLDKCLGNEFDCKFSNFVNTLKPLEGLQWSKECGLTNVDGFLLAEENIGDS